MGAPSIFSYFQSFIPGLRLIDGGDLQTLVKFIFGTSPALTALAGGGGPGATQLSAGINNIATVVTGNDSCVLPPAIPGLEVTAINNAAANTTNIFPAQSNPNNAAAAGDQIVPHNSATPGAAASGSVAVASGNVAVFYCYAAGLWKETLLT